MFFLLLNFLFTKNYGYFNVTLIYSYLDVKLVNVTAIYWITPVAFADEVLVETMALDGGRDGMSVFGIISIIISQIVTWFHDIYIYNDHGILTKV